MNDLGRLEDLPADYRAALGELNLVPLWPSLRAVLPPGRPIPRTQPAHWAYAALRPLLLRAGDAESAVQLAGSPADRFTLRAAPGSAR